MNPYDDMPDGDSSKPVAYDPEGRPLYLHPPKSVAQPNAPIQGSHVSTKPPAADGYGYDPRLRVQYANEPHVVHATRSNEPELAELNDDIKSKHDASVRDYPFLNLSSAEFVILDIKRHPIGIFLPIAVTTLLIAIVFVFVGMYPSMVHSGGIEPVIAPATVFGIGALFAIMIALGGAAALWVYLQNQFYMTNESVIQEIQESLFSRHEQTVSLGSIEDASFRKTGIMQQIFDYGTIRLSTEGEETTYTFHYVSSPKKQIAALNNAVESFKNGRPVQED